MNKSCLSLILLLSSAPSMHASTPPASKPVPVGLLTANFISNVVAKSSELDDRVSAFLVELDDKVSRETFIHCANIYERLRGLPDDVHMRVTLTAYHMFVVKQSMYEIDAIRAAVEHIAKEIAYKHASEYANHETASKLAESHCGNVKAAMRSTEFTGEHLKERLGDDVQRKSIIKALSYSDYQSSLHKPLPKSY